MQYNALHLHIVGSGRVAVHILGNFGGSGLVWGLPNAGRVGSGSKKVTCVQYSNCHPTQVNAPRPNPSQAGRYSIYLPRMDGRLS